ncbi:MAG: hypothetical protein JWQ44_762 [Chthoniobacter sp.]|nr:hypothetical protein [Chthoniobacter sp.]
MKARAFLLAVAVAAFGWITASSADAQLNLERVPLPPVAPKAVPVEELPALPNLRFDFDPVPRGELRPLREIEQFIQAPRPAPLIINRGGERIMVGDQSPVAAAEELPPENDPAGAHQLQFADGNRLGGTLAALDTSAQEIAWKRADASAPFSLPLAEVTRVTLGRRVKPSGKASATVKLAGGDWITAEQVNLQDGKVHLRMAGGAAFAVDRARVQWVFFSDSDAPECFDGPTSMAGFVTTGDWFYRDGALRTRTPGMIGRAFGAQPDRVEYLFEIKQNKGARTFRLTIGKRLSLTNTFEAGSVQFRVQNEQVQMIARSAGDMKMENATLPKPEGGAAPGKGLQAERQTGEYRIFHDRQSGRIVLYVDGRKVADWLSGSKGVVGETSFSFQPLSWSPENEQMISKVRVMPWDGRLPEEEGNAAAEGVTFESGVFRNGKIESLTAEGLRITTPTGPLRVPRDKVTMLRLAASAPRSEVPIIARVRLAERGEFDAQGLSFKNDQIVAQTGSLGQVSFPVTSIQDIQLLGTRWTSPNSGVSLVFANGDQLNGLLETLSGSAGLQWRVAKSEPPVVVQLPQVAGVRLGLASAEMPARRGVAARFRNGDLLFGNIVRLDAERLVLDTASAGQVSVPRDQVQMLYLGKGGEPPILHGAVEPAAWQLGVTANQQPLAVSLADAASQARNWRYFDGTFSPLTLAVRAPSPYAGAGSLTLGRMFPAMPEMVEFSFEVQFAQPPSFMSAQLFFDLGVPGYMLQLQPNSGSIYDMGPRAAGRGITPQQFQIPATGKERPLRKVRILADRVSGRLNVVIDGEVVAKFTRKPGERSRNLGRAVSVGVQAGTPCSFSNLWLAPWNGRMPDSNAVTGHSLLLANGDETAGILESVSPETTRFTSDVGVLEVPTERVSIIDLGGQAPSPSKHSRVRLTDGSSVSVEAYRLENGTVHCESALAGSLQIPRTAVQEIAIRRADLRSGKSGAASGDSR